MCGRYSLADPDFSQLKLELKFPESWSFSPRFNIGPDPKSNELVPVLVREERASPLQLVAAQFWFVPSTWRQPLANLPTSFNARSEQLTTRPFWKLRFETGRCLVPATGWREFPEREGKKRPVHFYQPDEAMFTFAGLWDRWSAPDGRTTTSFAIVTEPASAAVRPFHDRMPMRVHENMRGFWLDPRVSGAEALASVRSEPAAEPASYWSDPWGNSIRHEGVRCIEPWVNEQLELF